MAAWSRPFIRSGWFVPQDVAGLIALLGGKDSFVAKLYRFL